jgi:hypothetical protein
MVSLVTYCHRSMNQSLGWMGVYISYVALQANGIVNVALHQVSYLYFAKGGKISIMSNTNTESNSN